MKTLNEGHIEEASELSRVPAAMLRRTNRALAHLKMRAPSVNYFVGVLEGAVPRARFVTLKLKSEEIRHE